MKKIVTLLILITIIISCKEKVSSQLLNATTPFGAQIGVRTNVETGKATYVSVRLFDKDDAVIATKRVKVYVNNTQLTLVGGSRQRYYHNYSKYVYYTDSIPQSNHYIISVVSIDSVAKEIAAYTPIKKEDIKFKIIENKDNFKFKWVVNKSLKEINFSIRKTNYHFKNGYKDSVLTKITNRVGNYTLDKAFLQNDKSNTTTYFNAGISIGKEGLLHSKLLPKSSIIGKTGIRFDTQLIDSLYVKSM